MIMMGNKRNAILSILGPESPNVGDKRELVSDGTPEELKVIAQELIEAVHARNADQVCQALCAAFECLESRPHEEAEHTNEE
jgi:hypothetical protein